MGKKSEIKRLEKQLRKLKGKKGSKKAQKRAQDALEDDMKENGVIIADIHQAPSTRRSAPGANLGQTIMPKSFKEIVVMANQMATADFMIGKAFKDNPGACMAIITQACRWGMDPFAISTEAHVVNNSLGYSGKLIAAILEAHAPLKSRLRYKYSGKREDGTLALTVSGTFIGEDEPHELTTPMIKDIKTQNSPLWKSDPEQQLGYYGARAWGRRYCPETIMGLKSHEEAEVEHELENPKTNTEKALDRIAKKKAAAQAEQEEEVIEAEIIEEPEAPVNEPEQDPVEAEVVQDKSPDEEPVEAEGGDTSSQASAGTQITLPDEAHDWIEALHAFKTEKDMNAMWTIQKKNEWFKAMDQDQKAAVIQANKEWLAEITGD